jgi:hypothetical protein
MGRVAKKNKTQTDVENTSPSKKAAGDDIVNKVKANNQTKRPLLQLNKGNKSEITPKSLF